jgi:hypothetical protein
MCCTCISVSILVGTYKTVYTNAGTYRAAYINVGTYKAA